MIIDADGPSRLVVNRLNVRTQILARDPLVRTFSAKTLARRFGLISEMGSLVRRMRAVFSALLLSRLLAFASLVLLLTPVSLVYLL